VSKAGSEKPHWNLPTPETTLARERAEATKADEGLTPELSRAEGVGLND
jgi:hypothetical protein